MDLTTKEIGAYRNNALFYAAVNAAYRQGVLELEDRYGGPNRAARHQQFLESLIRILAEYESALHQENEYLYGELIRLREIYPEPIMLVGHVPEIRN